MALTGGLPCSPQLWLAALQAQVLPTWVRANRNSFKKHSCTRSHGPGSPPLPPSGGSHVLGPRRGTSRGTSLAGGTAQGRQPAASPGSEPAQEPHTEPHTELHGPAAALVLSAGSRLQKVLPARRRPTASLYARSC